MVREETNKVAVFLHQTDQRGGEGSPERVHLKQMPQTYQRRPVPLAGEYHWPTNEAQLVIRASKTHAQCPMRRCGHIPSAISLVQHDLTLMSPSSVVRFERIADQY